LVVIGILIALSINNWNVKRQLKTEEIKILKSLASEMKENLKEFETVYAEHLRKSDGINTVLNLKFENYSLDELDALGLSFISSWISNPSFSIFNTLVSSGKMELISNNSLKYTISKYKDLVNDYLDAENLALGNTRDFNWDYYSRQSAISAKVRFGMNPRNELELQADKRHYLKEYSSFYFQNSIAMLRLNMNEILTDGSNIRIETLALIEMLETEIMKLEN
jgi:hypothetical protein